jgi:iron complex outermembrane recepter protein
MKTIRHCFFGLGLAALCAAAAAESTTQPCAFSIESQPVDQALKTFANQSGLQLLFHVEGVAISPDLRTPRVDGTLMPEVALGRLLANTGLRYEFINARTVTIRSAKETEDGIKPTADLSQHGTVRLAWAETPDDEGSSRATSGTESQPTSSDPERAEPESLEEVVVTAQKRQERLKDVPISISVLSGTELDQSTVAGITEALNRVPGVVTDTALQGGGTRIVVRGVGAGGAIFTGSSPISYYLDGAPFGLVKSAILPDSNAYDLERVEVLRGPQGTLYGANAQNGVVRVLTRDANLDELEFKARTSASGTKDGGENYRGDVAVNIPLVEGRLAARAVAGYQDLSGWIDRPNQDDANDAELANLRLKVNAQPTEQLSIGLSAWLSRADFGAPSTAEENGQNSFTLDESMTTDYDVFGLRAGYDFGSFSLVSMSSYLDYKNTGTLDVSPFGLFAPTLFTGFDADAFTQEVLINSASEGSWRWSVGASYRDADDRLRQNHLGGGAPFDYANGSQSYAAFGEVGRRFLDEKFGWTLGLRYFHDDVFVKENINQGGPGEPLQDNRDSFDATTPRAVLTWYPSSDVTVYSSYSEGFRSGFDQDPGVARAFPAFPPAKPDKLHNYEIGAKAELLERRLSLDAAVYYIDWQDAQQVLGVPFQGSFVTAIVNGDSASGVGVDFGMTARPIDGLEMGVNMGWNDLTMDTGVFSEGALLFAKGDRLNLSPEYTVGAFAEYAFPVGASGFKGRLSGSANYTSIQNERILSAGDVTVLTSNSMLIARANFSIEAPARWSAMLFADNINNEDGTPLRGSLPDWDLRIRPRTVGLQVEYHW